MGWHFLTGAGTDIMMDEKVAGTTPHGIADAVLQSLRSCHHFLTALQIDGHG
jgi:hypothetical protein